MLPKGAASYFPGVAACVLTGSYMRYGPTMLFGKGWRDLKWQGCAPLRGGVDWFTRRTGCHQRPTSVVHSLVSRLIITRTKLGVNDRMCFDAQQQ